MHCQAQNAKVGSFVIHTHLVAGQAHCVFGYFFWKSSDKLAALKKNLLFQTSFTPMLVLFQCGFKLFGRQFHYNFNP